jgi:hypothetical protein
MEAVFGRSQIGRSRRRAWRPAPHLRRQAKGVVGAGHPSFIFNVRKKPPTSRVGLPRRVIKGPRGILYAYKSQDACKRVTRKGIGWCGCQARVTRTTGEALFYFQSLLGPCG